MKYQKPFVTLSVAFSCFFISGCMNPKSGTTPEDTVHEQQLEFTKEMNGALEVMQNVDYNKIKSNRESETGDAFISTASFIVSKKPDGNFSYTLKLQLIGDEVAQTFNGDISTNDPGDIPEVQLTGFGSGRIDFTTKDANGNFSPQTVVLFTDLKHQPSGKRVMGILQLTR